MRASNLCAIATIATLTASLACSPTAQVTAPSGAAPASNNVAVFIQVHTAPGAFALTLAGRTVSTPGDHRFDVPNGTQEVVGRLTITAASGNANLALRIHGLEGMDVGRLGGPERGTIRILDGPPPTVDECNVSYNPPREPGETTFRFQFNANRSVPINRRC